jgi:hypothetical protein
MTDLRGSLTDSQLMKPKPTPKELTMSVIRQLNLTARRIVAIAVLGAALASAAPAAAAVLPPDPCHSACSMPSQAHP